MINKFLLPVIFIFFINCFIQPKLHVQNDKKPSFFQKFCGCKGNSALDDEDSNMDLNPNRTYIEFTDMTNQNEDINIEDNNNIEDINISDLPVEEPPIQQQSVKKTSSHPSLHPHECKISVSNLKEVIIHKNGTRRYFNKLLDKKNLVVYFSKMYTSFIWMKHKIYTFIEDEHIHLLVIPVSKFLKIFTYYEDEYAESIIDKKGLMYARKRSDQIDLQKLAEKELEASWYLF